MCRPNTRRSVPASALRLRYNILVLPILFEEEVKAVIELASFKRYSDIHVTFLDQLKQNDRHRVEHDCGQYADGRLAQAIAGIDWPSYRPNSTN